MKFVNILYQKIIYVSCVCVWAEHVQKMQKMEQCKTATKKGQSVCMWGERGSVHGTPRHPAPVSVFKEMEYGIWKDKFSISICKQFIYSAIQVRFQVMLGAWTKNFHHTSQLRQGGDTDFFAAHNTRGKNHIMTFFKQFKVKQHLF